MNSITITIDHPPRCLSPNARPHFMVKARHTKLCRSIARHLAIQALSSNDAPRWKKARMQVMAYFKTKRFSDPANFMASMKAYEDGIADAGIVENDRGLWPERPIFRTDKVNPRIEITITEETS